MERSEVKQILLKVASEKYGMDLANVDELAPLAELQALNPKFDSMMAIEMIFDIEDELGQRAPSNTNQPSCLKDIIDALHQATLK